MGYVYFPLKQAVRWAINAPGMKYPNIKTVV
jgi:hypothetical protein